MEFEKQLNRIKKGQVSLVYLVQGKEPTYKSLRVKYFWTPLSLLKIKI